MKFLKTPYACSFSKNRIEFEVQSDMYFDAPLVMPSITITIDAIPQQATMYELSWVNPSSFESESIHFIVGNDDASDAIWDLRNYAIAITLEQYRDMLFDRLVEYAPANAWYSFQKVGSTSILIQAKQANSFLIPKWYSNQQSLYASTFISHTIVEGYIDPAIRPGYSMNALVYFESEYKSGDFVLVANLPCTVNEHASCKLDLSSVIDSEIENAWNAYPVPEEVQATKSDALRRFYVHFVESWAGESKVNRLASEVLFAHWGGVNHDDEMIADPMYLSSVKNSFLTWWPSGKKVAKTQHDWLSWMNAQPIRTVKIQLVITTDQDVHTFYPTTIELDTWESVTFSTGYEQEDLESLVPPDEVIFKWQWQICDTENNPISDGFVYYLDTTSCVRHHILYFNSFGMPETFHTFGEWVETMEVSSEIARRSQYFSLSTLFPQAFAFSSKHRNTFEASTGLLSNLEAKRLQPLLNTLIAFVYDQKRLIPIIVNTGSEQILDETQFTQRIGLKLLKANDSDRASFYDSIVDLIPNISCGLQSISLDLNRISPLVIGDLSVYLDGTLQQTVSWDAVSETFPLSPVITDNGNYRMETTIDGITLSKYVRYARPQVTAKTPEVGVRTLILASSEVSATVQIDWGDGGGLQTETYANTPTNVSNDYSTVQGSKRLIMEKECFDDIIEFTTTDFEMTELDISALTNLKTLSLYQCVSGMLYVSHLKNLEIIRVHFSALEGLKVGFQKNLTVLSLSNTSINSEHLDNLMIELWKYRKMYANVPQLFFQNLGFTPSATFNSIVDGTGVYAGEGLDADYNWIISIL